METSNAASSMICLSERVGYKPQFTQEVFENVAFGSRKPSAYLMKDGQEGTKHGKFCQKEFVEVF